MPTLTDLEVLTALEKEPPHQLAPERKLLLERFFGQVRLSGLLNHYQKILGFPLTLPICWEAIVHTCNFYIGFDYAGLTTNTPDQRVHVEIDLHRQVQLLQGPHRDIAEFLRSVQKTEENFLQESFSPEVWQLHQAHRLTLAELLRRQPSLILAR